MGLRKATLFMRSHRGLIPTEAGRFLSEMYDTLFSIAMILLPEPGV